MNPIAAIRRRWSERETERRRRRLLAIYGKAVELKDAQPRIDVIAKHGLVWLLIANTEGRHAVPLDTDSAGAMANAMLRVMRDARAQQRRREHRPA